MLIKKAEEYHNSMYSFPAGPHDLAKFAEQILKEFIQELEDNQQTVVWNRGCDSVVFINKNFNDRTSLDTIKERYIGNRDD